MRAKVLDTKLPSAADPWGWQIQRGPAVQFACANTRRRQPGHCTLPQRGGWDGHYWSPRHFFLLQQGDEKAPLSWLPIPALLRSLLAFWLAGVIRSSAAAGHRSTFSAQQNSLLLMLLGSLKLTMIVFCVLMRTCACCCKVVGSRGRSMGKGVDVAGLLRDCVSRRNRWRKGLNEVSEVKDQVLGESLPEAGEKAILAPVSPKMGSLDHRQIADTY